MRQERGFVASVSRRVATYLFFSVSSPETFFELVNKVAVVARSVGPMSLP